MLTGYLIGCIIMLTLMLIMVVIDHKRMQKKYTVKEHVGYMSAITVLWPIFTVLLVLEKFKLIKL